MRQLQAQFSHHYLLKLREGQEGKWEIAVDGPCPIRRHEEFLTDLEEARTTAYSRGRWHFLQRGIAAVPVDADRLHWAELSA